MYVVTCIQVHVSQKNTGSTFCEGFEGNKGAEPGPKEGLKMWESGMRIIKKPTGVVATQKRQETRYLLSNNHIVLVHL